MITEDLRMSGNALHLAPMPKKLCMGEGSYCLRSAGDVSIDDRELFHTIVIAMDSFLPEMSIVIGANYRSAQVYFYKESGLGKEGYRLSVSQDGVRIMYETLAGAFYGCMTLRQIIQECGTMLPYVEIEDRPDFEIRGYMLDVARNKIPTMDTLYQMVDFLASMKINHLQLYFEGAPFPYPSFPDMWTEASVITGEEILRLDDYCKERFIDLVPTQNTFGHMGQWLYDGTYLELAECPDGFVNPMNNQFCPWPQSVNPLNPDSFAHVRTMSDELLPYFSSENYNVCCDETLDLGLGKSKEYAERVGKGRVYLQFLMKLYDYCKEKGKKMLFWADIINHYPELIPELPKDVLALNWGYYDDLPTEDSCEVFEKNSIPYCVCPGTAVWNTQLGNTAQMLENISTTIEKGFRHGAVGVITTDWGDNGHIQGEAPHFAGLVYGAAMSWCVEENKSMDLAKVLNHHIFMDQNEVMGEYVLAIGDYAKVEPKKLENMTLSFLIMRTNIMNLDMCDEFTHEQLGAITAYLEQYEQLLYRTDMKCKDRQLYIREYELGVQFVKTAVKMGHFHLYKKENEMDKTLTCAYELCAELGYVISELQDTWLMKNKPTKLFRSIQPFVDNYKALKQFLRDIKTQ